MDKEQTDIKENVKNDSYRIKILLGKKLHKFSVNGKNLCEWNSDVIKM